MCRRNNSRKNKGNNVQKTKIGWTDYSWNPITGCTARSMTDLFQDGVRFEDLDEIFKIVISNPQHTFQVLTKRPKRMKEYFDSRYAEAGLIPNLWLGVSIENQKEADSRISLLLSTSAIKRFLSIEPMIGAINLQMIYPNEDLEALYYINCLDGTGQRDGGSLAINTVDWVIVGGESGAKRRTREMKGEWVQKIYDDCQKNYVPFFFKQWGSQKSLKKWAFEIEKSIPVIPDLETLRDRLADLDRNVVKRAIDIITASTTGVGFKK